MFSKHAVAGLDSLHRVTVDFMERNKSCYIRNIEVHHSVVLLMFVPDLP